MFLEAHLNSSGLFSTVTRRWKLIHWDSRPILITLMGKGRRCGLEVELLPCLKKLSRIYCLDRILRLLACLCRGVECVVVSCQKTDNIFENGLKLGCSCLWELENGNSWQPCWWLHSEGKHLEKLRFYEIVSWHNTYKNLIELPSKMFLFAGRTETTTKQCCSAPFCPGGL